MVGCWAPSGCLPGGLWQRPCRCGTDSAVSDVEMARTCLVPTAAPGVQPPEVRSVVEMPPPQQGELWSRESMMWPDNLSTVEGIGEPAWNAFLGPQVQWWVPVQGRHGCLRFPCRGVVHSISSVEPCPCVATACSGYPPVIAWGTLEDGRIVPPHRPLHPSQTMCALHFSLHSSAFAQSTSSCGWWRIGYCFAHPSQRSSHIHTCPATSGPLCANRGEGC